MLIDLFRSGLSPQEIIYYIIIYIFAMVLAFSIHEFMHAATAVWLGDPTPQNMGRLTLNPAAHVDPMGTVLLLVAGFGWGKPVLYNPTNLRRFKSSRWMNIMVHLAGVTGNFALSLVCSIIGLLFAGLSIRFSAGTPGIILKALSELFTYTYSFSMALLGFNLLPIPPLDGFHVLEELLPYRLKATNGYRKFEQISPMIIWIVFLVSTFTNTPVLSFVIGLIQLPFKWIISVISIPFAMLFAWIGLGF